MTAFFTAAELALQLQITDIDVDAANLMADLASDVIRDDLRQLIDAVAGETITLYGDGGEIIMLPEHPVTAVTSVLLDGQPLPAFDWRPSGALRRVIYPGSQFAGEQTMCWPFGVKVQVTYSHGYEDVPNTLKSVALQLAVRAYTNPEGLELKTVADVTYRYAQTAVSTMTLSSEQRSALDRYRALDI